MSWELLRQRAAEEGVPLAATLGEALHVLILDALFARPSSDAMAFQGGTCLHLVHGGYRFSEDLDFAGSELDAETAAGLVLEARGDIEKLTVQLLGPGDAEWRSPPDPRKRVQVFWYRFLPAGAGLKIRVKIEMARFPAYRIRPGAVRSQLDLLGRSPLVPALTPEELFAEKISAVLGRRSVRGRDLFDLWFLEEVLEASLEGELLNQKLADYAVPIDGLHMGERIGQVEAADLRQEMERFLPGRFRRRLRPGGYELIRARAAEVLRRAQGMVGLG